MQNEILAFLDQSRTTEKMTKLPTYRLSSLFILAVFVGLGANWWERQLRVERATEKLQTAYAHFNFVCYDPYLMVDAVNELRGLSHTDAMLALERHYENVDIDLHSFCDTVVPLVFEPNANCPEDKRWVFDFGKSQSGEFEMKNGLPTLVGWYQYEGMSPCWIPTSPLADARKWGLVRSGLLAPAPFTGSPKERKKMRETRFLVR